MIDQARIVDGSLERLETNMVFVAGVAFLSFALSYFGVALIRRWAERRRMLDIPNERSSHTRPTPRGGGLAIVVVTLAGTWLVFLGIPSTMPWARLAGYTLGAILIAIVSWLDDLHSLPNRVRFATHSLGAILAMVAFGFVHTVSVPFLTDMRLDWVGLPLSFLWIVGLTNAYNFMDGIDGLAGSQAVIAGLGWAVWGWWTNQPLVGMLGLFLAASSLGFLGHNWPPARIFMGDVGSAFLGYTFAVLPLLFNFGTREAMVVARSPFAGMLLVWPFVFDTFFTFVRRALKRENVFAAHRSHLYQRLVIAGYSHRSVTLLYTGLTLIGGVLASLWILHVMETPLLIVSVIPLLALALWTLVIRQEHRHGVH